jgi:hypothetical protein
MSPLVYIMTPVKTEKEIKEEEWEKKQKERKEQERKERERQDKAWESERKEQSAEKNEFIKTLSAEERVRYDAYSAEEDRYDWVSGPSGINSRFHIEGGVRPKEFYKLEKMSAAKREKYFEEMRAEHERRRIANIKYERMEIIKTISIRAAIAAPIVLGILSLLMWVYAFGWFTPKEVGTYTNDGTPSVRLEILDGVFIGATPRRGNFKLTINNGGDDVVLQGSYLSGTPIDEEGFCLWTFSTEKKNSEFIVAYYEESGEFKFIDEILIPPLMGYKNELIKSRANFTAATGISWNLMQGIELNKA